MGKKSVNQGLEVVEISETKKELRAEKPSVCCPMLDYVLAQKKPKSTSGFFRPFLSFTRTPSNKLTQKDTKKDVLYRATGKNSQNIYLNFCPFCGERLQPKTNGKAKSAKTSK